MRIHSSWGILAVVICSLAFQPLVAQKQFLLDGHIPPHPSNFPIASVYETFHGGSKDSMVSVVALQGPTLSNQCELISVWVANGTTTSMGLPYKIAAVAMSSVMAVTMSNPIASSTYRLNGVGVYSLDHFQRTLDFSGLTVPQKMNLAGTAKHGGEVALIPPGPFPLQAGLGDFGWYVVDDSLQYLYKRSVSCGIASVSYPAAGGSFLASGAMVYVGNAVMTGTGQKYNVVVATDSTALNPVKVVRLRRANGGHLSLTKVSECAAGILFSDETQNILVMVDHNLTQVLWSKLFAPTVVLAPPVEAPGGILHGLLSKYTVDTVPFFPFYYYRQHWGHYGVDMLTGSLLYGRYISSFYSQSFVDYQVVMPPYVLPDGQVREMQYLSDDYHSEWRMIDVDSTGYLGCYQQPYTPVLQNEPILLDVITGWTVDNVGVGALVTVAAPSFSYIHSRPFTLQCDCRPELTIVANPSGAMTYQFSAVGMPGYSFQWDFGDNTQFTGPNPTHTFAGPGTYLVTACRDFGCGIICDTLTLNVTCALPTATFTASSSLLTGTFNSAGSQGSVVWDFGDGGGSTLANPTHTYAAPGTYNVCLIATNICGADTVCQSLTVTCPLPSVAFTSSSTLLSATFNSSGSQGTLLWDFGDGSGSTLANPSHTYSVPGTYNVCLIATNSCGADTVCQPLTITCPLPSVAFTQSSTLLSASFNSSGSQGTLLWDFGDGGTSSIANPTHIYASPGTYNVCLIATNICGADTLCQPLTITCPLPSVAFTPSSTLLTANFNSSGSQGTLLWDFGDGSGSTLANPTHTYSASGTYNVCLIATNSCGADTLCQPLTITCPLPSVSFTQSSTLLTANFNSSGIQGTLLWDFGDGSGSTLANPMHTYASPGTYNVCLIATNSCGADTLCQPISVTCPLPSVAFTQSSTLLSATFNSSGSQGTLLWDFGDGSGSTLANPWHTYVAPGTYNVCLIATNSCGADTLCQPLTITCPLPSVTFTQSSTLLTANFNSSGSQGTLLWDFGDGGTSTLANPTHTYAAPGTYNVCLIATNSCGADTLCQLVNITCPLPTVNFTQSSTLLTVNFNSTGSQGSLHWDFGDGTTTTTTNPIHVYAAPGIYNVCLIATNSCGADTLCQLLTVACPLPGASFSFVSSGSAYQFQNQSSGLTNLQSLWNFGDGSTSTQSSPTHTYATNGNYLVCLTVTDSCGADSTCQNLAVVGGAEPMAVQIQIHPQPADEQVAVEWTGIEEPLASAMVYGIDGKCLETIDGSTISGNALLLETRSWASGVYFLKLQTSERLVVRRMVIAR